MTLPDLRQRDPFSCGRVCRDVVLAALGRPVPDPDGFPVSHLNGSHPQTIEDALRAAGLKVRRGEMDLIDLAHATARGRPVVCLVQHAGGGHWLVAGRVTGRSVYLQCPDRGPVRAGRRAFRRDWWDRHDGREYRGFGIEVWE